MKKMILALILVSMVLISGCSQQEITPKNVEMEENTIVVVNLKPFSDHNSESIEAKTTREEKTEEFRTIVNLSDEKTDEILEGIPPEEFKLRFKFANGFSGWATEEGIKKLELNPSVENVLLIK